MGFGFEDSRTREEIQEVADAWRESFFSAIADRNKAFEVIYEVRRAIQIWVAAHPEEVSSREQTGLIYRIAKLVGACTDPEELKRRNLDQQAALDELTRLGEASGEY